MPAKPRRQSPARSSNGRSDASTAVQKPDKQAASASRRAFDRIPLSKAELLRWEGLACWAIVNAFTVGTIFFGFVLMLVPTPWPAALTAALGLPASWAPLVLAGIAVSCDIADGKLARRWKMQSQVGATFDGLADMMAFGVAPATYFALACGNASGVVSPIQLFAITTYIGAAVYRISRFLVLTFSYYNGSFKGMPTNLAGCLFHASFLFLGFDHWCQPYVLLVLAWLMVSALPFEKPWFLR